MKTIARCFVLALALLLSALPAAADQTTGQKRFNEASAAYQQGRYRDAARLFLLAYEADRHPELVYNAARAYDKAGDLPKALTEYRRYLTLAPASDARAEVERRIRLLEQKLEADRVLQVVRISSEPSGASVFLDGRDVGKTPWTGEIRPGTHVVELRRPGFALATKRFELEPDRSLEVAVTLREAPLVPASLTMARETETARPGYAAPFRDEVDDEPTVRPLTWVAFGVGTALLGGALAFELARQDSEEDAENARTQIEHQEHFETMEDRRSAAIALGIAGGVTILAGTVMFAIDLNRDRRVGIGVGCGERACGVAAHGRLP